MSGWIIFDICNRSSIDYESLNEYSIGSSMNLSMNTQYTFYLVLYKTPNKIPFEMTLPNVKIINIVINELGFVLVIFLENLKDNSTSKLNP